jgi:hypothetical protein
MSNTTQQPTFNLQTDADLSKFLLGAIRDVRKNELDVDRATVISQLADKYTKNEMMRCVKAKLLDQVDSLDLSAEINKQLMQKT